MRCFSGYTLLITWLISYLFFLAHYSISFLEEEFVPVIKPSELAIVTYYVPQKNASHVVNHSDQLYASFADASISNLAEYAQFHGHAFFYLNEHLVDTNSKSAYWGKMDVIKSYMDKGFQWILWTDIDVLFTRKNRSIFEKWIKPQNESIHLLFVDECVDNIKVGPIRSGFFAVRNSLEGRSFLKSWSDMYDEYKDVHDPEQHALENMILEEKWANMSTISSHTQIHTYPHCLNGSALSVHFPGTTKYRINEFSGSHMINQFSTSGFKIRFVNN